MLDRTWAAFAFCSFNCHLQHWASCSRTISDQSAHFCHCLSVRTAGRCIGFLISGTQHSHVDSDETKTCNSDTCHWPVLERNCYSNYQWANSFQSQGPVCILPNCTWPSRKLGSSLFSQEAFLVNLTLLCTCSSCPVCIHLIQRTECMDKCTIYTYITFTNVSLTIFKFPPCNICFIFQHCHFYLRN